MDPRAVITVVALALLMVVLPVLLGRWAAGNNGRIVVGLIVTWVCSALLVIGPIVFVLTIRGVQRRRHLAAEGRSARMPATHVRS